MKVLCRLFGHKRPPRLDRYGTVLLVGWAICARCGVSWFFKGRAR